METPTSLDIGSTQAALTSRYTASNPNSNVRASRASPKENNARNVSASSNSQVMNETLSVIDEHITDMRGPGRSASPRNRRAQTADSASEYSNMNDSTSRLSYIKGSETEEEEDEELTEQKVKKWSPKRVAKYLEEVGVDQQHCEVFREQEFNGESILGMEQSLIFMKELELGPIGRRLRTWQKIKVLQDAVAPPPPSQTRRISEHSQKVNRRTSSGGASMVPNLTNPLQRSGSDYADVLQVQAHPGRVDGTSTLVSNSGQSSPRPSAASVRSIGHSRRHSSLEQNVNTSTEASPSTAKNNDASPVRSRTSHGKQPSFDRNWNMGPLTPGTTNGTSTPAQAPAPAPAPSTGTATGTAPARPVSSMHSYTRSNDRPQFDKRDSTGPSSNTSGADPDRGYVSGSEADGPRAKGVLRKRGASHSRISSHESDSSTKRRSRAFSFMKDRSSRASSPVRVGDVGTPIESSFRHKHHGIDKKPGEGTRIVSEPVKSAKTNLDQENEDKESTATGGDDESQLVPDSPNENRKSLRAISNAVTGREKALHTVAPDSLSPTTASSPRSASSSTLSKSIEYEDANQSKYSTATSAVPTQSTRRKTKKETTAYTRGLEKKPPQEQMIGCEFSGWMKKKSSSLVANWKPRLFVLRGRRLSYYYSENDTEEKGLIDITSHRVLPADNERLTGLHAQIAKATSSPTSPAGQNSATFNSSNTSPTTIGPDGIPIGANTSSNNTSPTTFTHPNTSGNNLNTPSPISAGSNGQPPPNPFTAPGPSTSDGGFIFKLVPPRAGFSKAVNFTKPTVHYFAVPTIQEGRQWMAALMKATIDRDDNAQVVTTYGQKTISLAKARARKERPPALQEGETVGGAVETAAGTNVGTGEGGDVTPLLDLSGLEGGPMLANTELEKVDEARDAEKVEEERDTFTDYHSITDSHRSRPTGSITSSDRDGGSYAKSKKSTESKPTASATGAGGAGPPPDGMVEVTDLETPLTSKSGWMGFFGANSTNPDDKKDSSGKSKDTGAGGIAASVANAGALGSIFGARKSVSVATESPDAERGGSDKSKDGAKRGGSHSKKTSRESNSAGDGGGKKERKTLAQSIVGVTDGLGIQGLK